MGMTGLETLAEREAKFNELRQEWRQQLHKLQGTVYQYRLSELERGMDVLVHQAAELAREPLMRHLLALAATKPLPPAGEAALRDNLQEAWAALAMIREAVETLGPIGAMPAAEHLAGPTFLHEADAIVAGIAALTKEPGV